MKAMNLGVAGLGRMGGIFANRLSEAGFNLSVWNRSREKSTDLVERGAAWCSSPAALAEANEVILISMADEEALNALFSGPGGLLASKLDGKLLIDTSTVSPEVIRSISRRVAAQGGLFIDAPVLGTVGPARQGKVVFLVGGPTHAIERARPIFDVLGRKVIPMGEVGSGMTMKLVINLHLATYWHSLAEAIAMGAGSGIGLDAMLSVLEDSPVATAALSGKKDILLGRSDVIGFDISGVVKDMRTALDLAATIQSDARTAVEAMKGFSLAADEGLGDKDVAAIVAAVCARTGEHESL